MQKLKKYFVDALYMLSLKSLPSEKAPWRMIGKIGGGGKIDVRDNLLEVTYKAGDVGSASGITFHAQPQGFPATEATLRYQVFFPADFEWRQGGKLPGMYIGGIGASGGNWSRDCGSVRVVFKEGGAAVAYIYVPLQVCDNKNDRDALDKVEGAAFKEVVQHTSKGSHVWRDGSAGTFKPGAWNDVAVRVKMNAPHKKDGVLEMSINGHTSSLPFVWRTSLQTKIEGIAFATFFGGSTRDAAAPQGAKAKFRAFSYETKN